MMKEGEINPGSAQQGTDRKPYLGMSMSLLSLVYFMVSKGMYGYEQVMSMGPTAVVLSELIKIPTWYFLPLVIIVADCSIA